jgi:hypothetical protein
MICYRDMTFCSAAPQCKNSVGCYRHFDKLTRAKADIWAIQMGMVDDEGNPAPWVAYSDFSPRCESYSPKAEVKV